jgi:hypothetical protein
MADSMYDDNIPGFWAFCNLIQWLACGQLQPFQQDLINKSKEYK